jgi:hypothetical protein
VVVAVNEAVFNVAVHRLISQRHARQARLQWYANIAAELPEEWWAFTQPVAELRFQELSGTTRLLTYTLPG